MKETLNIIKYPITSKKSMRNWAGFLIRVVITSLQKSKSRVKDVITVISDQIGWTFIKV